MSITRQTPNTVWLGGQGTEVNDVFAGAAITPGHLIQRYNSSGMKLRKHATAGAAGAMYALNQSMQNKGLSDAYAAGDLVEAVIFQRGASVYAFIASGNNIANGDALTSNGDGSLKAAGSGVVIAYALEAVDNSAGATAVRLRAEVA